MSAKDRRKSIALDLDPGARADLERAARAIGARSLAAAARHVLRVDLGLTEPPRIGPDRGLRPLRRARALRLQLEPSLRDALGLTGAPEGDAERVRTRLTTRLALLVREARGPEERTP